MFEEQVLEAIAYVRKRTDLVREVGDWQTLIDMRHADECLLYVSDFIVTVGASGLLPVYLQHLTWDALQARSARTGLTGRGGGVADLAVAGWAGVLRETVYERQAVDQTRGCGGGKCADASVPVPKNCTNDTFRF